MAKLNLNNQENPFAWALFGSLGFLTCLIVSVMGIKLWWFKHRLSFEQTTIQNGAAGGGQPSVVVARREKKRRFSKDKRLSQQIYHNVEVHGVFKQKKEEDDVLIQGTAPLPPVRLRQAESAPSLLLPPPRNKRRPQYVQSTAFEELGERYESAAPSPAYSQETLQQQTPPTYISVVGETETKDQGVCLTFEEVEKEFPPNVVIKPENVVELMAVPEPPKRINRSSSASVKQEQEKPHRFLKTSQSISVPEFRKVIERRPTGFHRPDEIDDLTKIDDLEEPQFEKFGERRPTGYIKYEEVDFQAGLRDYRDGKETENMEEINYFYDSGWLANRNMEPIEALRDEEIVYQNPTSPDICEINEAIENYEKSTLFTNQREDNKSEPKYYNDLSKVSTTPSYVYPGDEVKAEKSKLNEQNITTNGLNNPDFYNQELIENSRTLTQRSELVLNDYENNENSRHNHVGQRIVSFDGPDDEGNEKSTLNQRRPTAYVRNTTSWESEEVSEFCEPTESTTNHYLELKTRQKSSTNLREDLNQQNVKFNMDGNMDEVEDKFTLNQRRPTEFARTPANANDEDDWQPQTVTFDVDADQAGEGYEDKFTLNQRRPTTYVRDQLGQKEEEAQEEQNVRFDLIEGTEDKFTLNQRRPTAFIRFQKEENEEVEQQTVVTFQLKDNSMDSVDGYEDKFTLNQRRPTAFKQNKPGKEGEKEALENGFEAKVKFDLEENEPSPEDDKFTLNQRRPTKYTNSQEATQENYIVSSTDDKESTAPKNANEIEALKSRRAENHDSIWQELEQDIQLDFAQNIEEEFARIRQSFELNEADILEVKDELRMTTSPTGFGKSIDDDWENFEQLKPIQSTVYEIVQDHEDICITYSRDVSEQDITTVSILKETKSEQKLEVDAKPRKSKVTFDFKTEEHVIPARTSPSDEEDYSQDDYDDDADDDVYDKPPPPIPRQRLTSLNYSEDQFYEPVVAPPITISLFGSQLSPTAEADEPEDSWSAIRKHRHLTSQFQNLTLDSGNSPPPPSQPPPPLPAGRHLDGLPSPKPAYRNPMAQLAIQRAKEVRADTEGFKSRSIKDAKKRTSQQEVLNLSDDFNDTEA